MLPGDLEQQVEAATGARVVDVRPRGGGGASREGAELTLQWPDGRRIHAYMNYDIHGAGAGDDAAFAREVAALEAFSGPLSGTGIRVARFIAAIPVRRALIAERVAGEADFNRLVDPVERETVARDYMAQLARLHQVEQPIPALGVDTFEAMAAARLDALRRRLAAQGDDPLITIALDWLSENVPAAPARRSIVHGDAGPANFLFANGRVTALLDWELVHIGDPMADLAMICLRTLFQPFVPLPAAFAAYEAAGGAPVDLARIRWWRLLFQAQFAGTARYTDPASAPPPNFGMNLVYTTIHRRVLAEALAEVAGVALPTIALPEAAPGPRDRSFVIALDDLRETIVPRLADQQASAKAKGLARLVKYWRAADRFGSAFNRAECAEIDAALGTRSATLEEARRSFAAAVAARRVEFAEALVLCHAREQRESRLMADAMGALATAHFAPLE